MAAANSTLNARYIINVKSAQSSHQAGIIYAGHVTAVEKAVRIGLDLVFITGHHVRSSGQNDTFGVRTKPSSMSKASFVIHVANRPMHVTGGVTAATMANGAIVTNVSIKEESADIR